MVVAGGCIASLGLLTSSWAPNLYVLFFTYGMLIGIGASFCYMTSIVAVNRFFHKRKSLATGVVVSGSGMMYCRQLI
jgi:hypothetical protein